MERLFFSIPSRVFSIVLSVSCLMMVSCSGVIKILNNLNLGNENEYVLPEVLSGSLASGKQTEQNPVLTYNYAVKLRNSHSNLTHEEALIMVITYNCLNFHLIGNAGTPNLNHSEIKLYSDKVIKHHIVFGKIHTTEGEVETVFSYYCVPPERNTRQQIASY
jgi:hypothetical protein